MTVYVPEGYGQVIHSFSLTGDPEPMAITYGITTDDGETFTVDGIAAELHDAFGDIIMPFLKTTYTMKQTEVRFQDTPLPADPTLGLFVGDRVGGTGNDVLPQNSALLVHKRSNQPGRKGRGRLYVPGCIREAQVDDKGIITALEVTGLQTAFTSFRTRMNAGAAGQAGTPMVILHTITEDDATPTPTLVTALVVDSVIATQRRRLRK